MANREFVLPDRGSSWRIRTKLSVKWLLFVDVYIPQPIGSFPTTLLHKTGGELRLTEVLLVVQLTGGFEVSEVPTYSNKDNGKFDALYLMVTF